MESSKNIIIPPHFQCPNFYVDVLDEYLTAEESKVLIHAVREILGWRDSLQTRQKHIARDVFLNGRTVNDKKVYGGVNICADTLNKVLDALHKFRILVKVGSSRDPRGQLFKLTEDVSQIDLEGLKARKEGKKTTNKARVQNNPSNKKPARLSHRQESNSSVTQTSYSSVAQTTYSSAAQTTYSSVTQTERKTGSERHNEKDIKRESAEEKSNTEETSTNSLSLSSSPSGMVYLLFFRAESEHLSSAQVRMICDISDSELFKSAIEYLQGNGVQKLWNKISLIKTKMQELAAAASVQPGAVGAASPAMPGALLKQDGNPVAFTAKAKQRQANLSYLNNLISSPADVVIDVQPLTAIAGA